MMIDEILDFEKFFLGISSDKSGRLFYNFLNEPSNEKEVRLLATSLKYLLNTKREFKHMTKFWLLATSSGEILDNTDPLYLRKIEGLANLLAVFVCLSLRQKLSLSSSEEHDHKNYIDVTDFRSNLNILINQLFVWLEIHHSKPFLITESRLMFDLDKLIHSLEVHLRILHLLQVHNFDEITSNKKYLTHSFIIPPSELRIEKSLKFSFTPFRHWTSSDDSLYIYSDHFSTVYPVLKTNSFSGYKFNLGVHQNELLDNLNNNWVMLDIEQLKKILKHQLEELQVVSIDASIQELKKIKKIYEKTPNNPTFKTVNSRLSKLLHCSQIDEIIKKIPTDVKLFLPYRFDFRGRLYFLSDCSPTHKKEFRFCLYKGWYDVDVFEEKYHYLNSLINDTLVECFPLLDSKILDNLESMSRQRKIWIVWNLISISEVIKADLGETVHINTFVTEGLKLFNSTADKKLDVFEKIKIEYHRTIIKEILTNKKCLRNRLVGKDTTASCFQHLIKALGYKNINSLKVCNLYSKNIWYDPYTFLLSDWKKTFSSAQIEKFQIFSHYFIRKTIKKTVMIQGYGAKRSTCWNDFCSLISIPATLDERKILEAFFYNLYNYLGKVESLTAKPTPILINEILLNNKYPDIQVTGSEGSAVMLYKKSVQEQKEKNINGRRYTRKTFKLTKINDNGKVTSSIRANYTHFLDASLMRWYIRKYPCLTIHDCILVPYTDLTYSIALLNEGMRLDFDDIGAKNFQRDVELFSIFIMI